MAGQALTPKSRQAIHGAIAVDADDFYQSQGADVLTIHCRETGRIERFVRGGRDGNLVISPLVLLFSGAGWILATSFAFLLGWALLSHCR